MVKVPPPPHGIHSDGFTAAEAAPVLTEAVLPHSVLGEVKGSRTTSSRREFFFRLSAHLFSRQKCRLGSLQPTLPARPPYMGTLRRVRSTGAPDAIPWRALNAMCALALPRALLLCAGLFDAAVFRRPQTLHHFPPSAFYLPLHQLSVATWNCDGFKGDTKKLKWLL